MEILSVLRFVTLGLDKNKVSYALAGGFASNLWVREERAKATYDVDFVLESLEEQIIETLMKELESPHVSILRSPDMDFRRVYIKRILVDDIIVDFIQSKNRPFMESAFTRIASVPHRERSIPLLSREDLFLFKGLAKRESDVAPMCALSEADDFDRPYAEKWARKLGVWQFSRRALKK